MGLREKIWEMQVGRVFEGLENQTAKKETGKFFVRKTIFFYIRYIY